jgi:hypothetical protein
VASGAKTLSTVRRAGSKREIVAVKVNRRMRAHTLSVSATFMPARAAGKTRTAKVTLARLSTR